MFSATRCQPCKDGSSRFVAFSCCLWSPQAFASSSSTTGLQIPSFSGATDAFADLTSQQVPSSSGRRRSPTSRFTCRRRSSAASQRRFTPVFRRSAHSSHFCADWPIAEPRVPRHAAQDTVCLRSWLCFACWGRRIFGESHIWLRTVCHAAVSGRHATEWVTQYVFIHDGEWPRSWDDVRQSAADSGCDPERMIKTIRSYVAIDFQADPRVLATQTAGEFHAIRSLDAYGVDHRVLGGAIPDRDAQGPEGSHRQQAVPAERVAAWSCWP